jgi:hypothetical protein
VRVPCPLRAISGHRNLSDASDERERHTQTERLQTLANKSQLTFATDVPTLNIRVVVAACSIPEIHCNRGR